MRQPPKMIKHTQTSRRQKPTIDSNKIQTHSHLVLKRTLKDLAKLT